MIGLDGLAEEEKVLGGQVASGQAVSGQWWRGVSFYPGSRAKLCAWDADKRRGSGSAVSGQPSLALPLHWALRLTAATSGRPGRTGRTV